VVLLRFLCPSAGHLYRTVPVAVRVTAGPFPFPIPGAGVVSAWHGVAVAWHNTRGWERKRFTAGLGVLVRSRTLKGGPGADQVLVFLVGMGEGRSRRDPACKLGTGQDE
jgi:hypothetical protein